jgi:signal peptidase I
MTDTTLPTRTDRRQNNERRSRSIWLFLRDILIIFIIAIVASVLIKTFLVRSFYIPSGSMENTLQVNDRILVNQLEPRFIPVERGDVVVFSDPGGWLMPAITQPAPNAFVGAVDWVLEAIGLAPSDANDHLIKRVIGLPGDHVECCNALGQMSINDVPLDEPYIKLPAGQTAASGKPFDITVPPNSLWVMGDNRYNSADSRFNQDKPGNGFVPIDDVVGRALWITWPTDRWTTLDNYSSVFSSVKAGSSQ